MRNGAIVLTAVVLLMSWIVMDCVFATGKSFKGRQAPEIALSKAANCKEKPSLAKMKGKAVLVEFWATWCPPCRKSIPHLIDLHNKYKDKGLVVIGITQEDASKVTPFMKQNGMIYIVGIDEGGRTNQTYGIESIPMAYLIGPDGVVAWEGHPMSLKETDIEAVLDKVENK
ncbi:MAG: TlpA disulfide reductase family protein [Planctomycetota bacterium]